MSDRSSAYLINAALNGADDAALARSNRRFTQSFDRLVYTQIWEDPLVDIEAMAIAPTHRIVTICSAGCNALSYLTADPAEVHAVDLNFSHLALADLKRAALSTLTEHADLASLFVTASGEANRAILRRVACALTPMTRAYWMDGRSPRAEVFVEGFYRTGLLGTAIRLCGWLARLHGVRLSDALALDAAAAQAAWVRANVRPIFMGRLASALFSLRHPLFMLGIPPRQFNLLCDNQPERMAEVLAERVERLAGAARSSENYFLWQGFGGGYAPGAAPSVPPYLEPGNFEALRARASRLLLSHDSLTNVLAQAEARSLDRYVLLDAQDWMDAEALSALWAQMTRTARPGARAIFRTAGATPPFAGAEGAWTSWRRLEELSASLHRRDRSGIYGGFHVYELAE
jgi:S-adenosylmethionine-diacylglycerol 3-amino-3-carboxypropyl transferase